MNMPNTYLASEQSKRWSLMWNIYLVGDEREKWLFHHIQRFCNPIKVAMQQKWSTSKNIAVAYHHTGTTTLSSRASCVIPLDTSPSHRHPRLLLLRTSSPLLPSLHQLHHHHHHHPASSPSSLLAHRAQRSFALIHNLIPTFGRKMPQVRPRHITTCLGGGVWCEMLKCEYKAD